MSRFNPFTRVRANDDSGSFSWPGRFNRRLLGSVAATVGIIAGLMASGPLAGATPTYKFYSDGAQTNPSTVYAGATAAVTFTFNNSSTSNQPFGSAEIAVGNLPPNSVGPVTTDNAAWSGAVLSNNPAIIKLTSTTGIPPAGSLNVYFNITPTAAGTITLGTVVKQSNDFSGTGNNFKNSGTDPTITVVPLTLSFDQQPSGIQQFSASAPSNDVVNMCPPVSVLVQANGTGVNGVVVTLTNGGADPGLVWNGQPVSSSNIPTATSQTVNNIDGIATFGSCGSGLGATTIGTGYTLVANSTAASHSSPSNQYSVVASLQNCPVGSCNSGPFTSSGTGTTGSIGATFTAAGQLLGSFGQGISLTCDLQVTTSAVTPDPIVTQASGSASAYVTLVFPKKVVNNLANNGTPLMQVCAGASAPFLGPSQPNLGGTYPYQGLVPDCPTTFANEICVVSRSKNAANETIVIYVSDLTDPGFW